MREGITVDPVTVIVTALGAGAALGVKDTASAAVKDAYSSLKGLAKKRFANREDAQLVLAQYEKSPAKWESMITGELTEAGAARDAELLAAAQLLLSLADPAGSQAGKYNVDVSGGQGVQVGDHNTQHNTFGATPEQ
jgi:hypothetical protein